MKERTLSNLYYYLKKKILYRLFITFQGSIVSALCIKVLPILYLLSIPNIPALCMPFKGQMLLESWSSGEMLRDGDSVLSQNNLPSLDVKRQNC